MICWRFATKASSFPRQLYTTSFYNISSAKIYKKCCKFQAQERAGHLLQQGNASAGTGDVTYKRLFQERTGKYSHGYSNLIAIKLTIKFRGKVVGHRRFFLDVWLIRQVSELVRLVRQQRQGVHQLPIAGHAEFPKCIRR